MSIPNKIAIIGLGYVGLPLAVEFARQYEVLGFDIDAERVGSLQLGIDHTRETDAEDLKLLLEASSNGLRLTSDPAGIKDCQLYIITVPTPVDRFKSPDLTHLLDASAMVGRMLEPGDTVIYESTVYPGCTEEDCIPVLERESGLRLNSGFYCGYSPERISPGDKINKLTTIRKVTSGSNPETAARVDALYRSIIPAGTHLAPSIKVAEASKAIENAQRDINISFVNELAVIFDRIGIDTGDVIAAAATKWNFLAYKPGLVGGHCIGVDPYYLVHKAQSLGYHPQVILSGRRVNDTMGMFVANKVIKLLISKGHKINGCKALILGFTFKENCPDTRNTRVVDIYTELRQFGLEVDVFDPVANAPAVLRDYGLGLLGHPAGPYDAIVLAVAHSEFAGLDYAVLKNGENAVVYDTKGFLDRRLVDGRL